MGTRRTEEIVQQLIDKCAVLVNENQQKDVRINELEQELAGIHADTCEDILVYEDVIGTC